MVCLNRLIKIQNTLATAYLESDGLVGPDEDADPQIVAAHNLREAGVLGVGEPHPAQLHRHLQAEGPQLPAQFSFMMIISNFMDRSATLCTLQIAVDF
jgi:hypothetical protein